VTLVKLILASLKKYKLNPDNFKTYLTDLSNNNNARRCDALKRLLALFEKKSLLTVTTLEKLLSDGRFRHFEELQDTVALIDQAGLLSTTVLSRLLSDDIDDHHYQAIKSLANCPEVPTSCLVDLLYSKSPNTYASLVISGMDSETSLKLSSEFQVGTKNASYLFNRAHKKVNKTSIETFKKLSRMFNNPLLDIILSKEEKGYCPYRNREYFSITSDHAEHIIATASASITQENSLDDVTRNLFDYLIKFRTFRMPQPHRNDYESLLSIEDIVLCVTEEYFKDKMARATTKRDLSQAYTDALNVKANGRSKIWEAIKYEVAARYEDQDEYSMRSFSDLMEIVAKEIDKPLSELCDFNDALRSSPVIRLAIRETITGSPQAYVRASFFSSLPSSPQKDQATGMAFNNLEPEQRVHR
jgi:hypothetical protein